MSANKDDGVINVSVDNQEASDQSFLSSLVFWKSSKAMDSFNIVLISSIFPPQAKLIPRKDGLKKIKHGQILFTIYSRNQTNEPHRMISASVGLALPKDRTRYGYLSEYDSFGQNEKQAGDYAEDIAAQMLASSLGIPFDIDKSWDEKRQQWSISGKIYKTQNITMTAKGDKSGKWTTVFSAACLLL